MRLHVTGSAIVPAGCSPVLRYATSENRLSAASMVEATVLFPLSAMAVRGNGAEGLSIVQASLLNWLI